MLLPLLRAGVDVDGCDLSADMLQSCRSKAAEEGFDPNLYDPPVHAFELPRKYNTIYLCDSFDLAGSRDHGLQALRRYAHLEHGGALLLDIQPGCTAPDSWGF